MFVPESTNDKGTPPTKKETKSDVYAHGCCLFLFQMTAVSGNLLFILTFMYMLYKNCQNFGEGGDCIKFIYCVSATNSLSDFFFHCSDVSHELLVIL